MNSFRSKNFRIALWLFFLTVTTSLVAQKQQAPKSLADAQNNQKLLSNQIKNLNEVITATAGQKKSTMLHVSALNLKISAREELINNINYEIKVINGQISKKQKEYDRKKNDLDTLKALYKNMVYYAFRNKEGYNDLMFVFASKNFNQAYQRVKYMQQITERRKQIADSIVKVQGRLVEEKKLLQKQIDEKKNLLGTEEQEKVLLAKEKEEQEDNLNKLSSREKQLKEELEQKKKYARELDNKINEMMKEIMAKAEKERKEREEKERKKREAIALTKKDQKVKDKTQKDRPDPELEVKKDIDVELSEDFASNKGRLPWPVSKGAITQGFGPHEHPKIKDFMIVNPGVDIATPTKGGVAHAIFDGEVSMIASMPDGNGKFVIVRHGTYLSVYTNLSAIYVKNGDKIKVKQNIGEIAFSEDKGGTVMNLQIWKGQNKLNPEDWLVK